MKIAEIILTACGLLLGTVYAASHRFKKRLLPITIKACASCCFVALGAVCFAAYGDAYAKVTLTALVFGAVADIVFGMRHIVEKKRKPLFFNAGVGLFAVGHFFYIAAFYVLAAIPLWIFALALAPAFLICWLPKWIKGVKYGKMRFVIFGYAFILSSMLLASIYYASVAQAPHNAGLAVTAAALFAFSDAVLLCEIFIKESPPLRFLNLIPYYSGQLLFALSIAHLAR